MQHISSTKRQRAEIDMRTFAKGAGTTVRVPTGGVVFTNGEAGDCMYIVQSGTIDMMIGDTVIETIGANEALGFMSMIDEMPRSSTARAREDCELSLIDAHLPLYGRRGAEFFHLHHARARATHSRHEQGDLSGWTSFLSARSCGSCLANRARRAFTLESPGSREGVCHVAGPPPAGSVWYRAPDLAGAHGKRD
jgi:CRP/FNR family transcriptional regulator, cyclic AMP receptor protein